MESVQRPVSIEEIATKAMGASRPVIGIVPTYDPNEGILRMNNHYAQAVVAAGGAPLIVPFTSGCCRASMGSCCRVARISVLCATAAISPMASYPS